jgi:hypothetical protein
MCNLMSNPNIIHELGDKVLIKLKTKIKEKLIAIFNKTNTETFV